MYLKYSKTKTPYIEFDNGAKLIFSSITKDEHGYKYLVFSHTETNDICLSAAKVKKKRYATISEKINFTTTMKFTKIPNNAKKVLTSITLNYLKKTFEGLIVNDYFPEKNLKELDKILSFVDDTDEINDDITANESFDDDNKEVRRNLKKSNGKSLKIKIKPKINFKKGK